MNQTKRSVILTELAKKLLAGGSWCGETHIQKATYFIQELLGVPTEYHFILYKHGPYSFDLHHELVDFRAARLFRLQAMPPYGPSLVPTEVAEEIRARFPRTLKRYQRQIDFVASRLAEKTVAELERIATALYVTRKEGLRLPEDRARSIHHLKPHVSFVQALAAVTEIDKMETAAQGLVISNDQ